MNQSRLWKGALNVFDLLFTRGADAIASILLVYILSPEEYSVFGVAQSLIAPLFILFINPGTILYRDYGMLAKYPEELAARASSFRAFNRLLFISSSAICLVLAHFSFRLNYPNIVFATTWALMLTVGQSLMNIDREVIRLAAQWKKLIYLNIVQKLMTISLIYFILFKKIGGIEMLAVCCAVQQVLFMIIYQVTAFGFEETLSDLFLHLPSLKAAFHSLRDFSLVHHLNWTIFSTVQTLDVLLWGLLKPDRKFEVGIYSSVLKLTNLITALPTAMGITLMIWASQRTLLNEKTTEIRPIQLGLLIVALFSSGLCFLVWGWKIPIIYWFSRGRWSTEQITDSFRWLAYLLPAYGLVSISSYFWYFLSVQLKPKLFLYSFSLPILVCSFSAYGWFSLRGDMLWLAKSNLFVAFVMVMISGTLIFSKDRTRGKCDH